MSKFLIIDDDPDDREMFCEAMLEAVSDSICYSAPNGRQAITALNSGEMEIPDLIFLDINMPVMNGWQCLSRLKETESFKNIPTIMYSTSSYPEDLRKAKREGALCFFTKPSNFRELKNSLAIVASHITVGSLDSLTEDSPLFLK